MEALLRYLYTPGETIRAAITARNVLAESDTLVQIQSATEVLALAESIYTLRVTSEVRAPGAEPMTGTTVYRQDDRGKIVDSQGDVPLQSALLFPAHAVEAGDYWENQNPGPGGAPTTVEVDVDEIETRGDETIARLSTRSELPVPEPDATGFVESSLEFSVTRGRVLHSRTVSVITWADGRKLTSTVERKLL